jgi:imidazolonepropionase
MRIVNIGKLIGISSNNNLLKGAEMAALGEIDHAYLEYENGLIRSFGSMTEVSEERKDDVDARGQLVAPAFVDCHTHLVFASGREEEFVDRIKGLSYEEIAHRGGGILNSSRKLGLMSEDELYDQATERLEKIMASGTGAIEIKSGYGLDLQNELKMLKVIRRLKDSFKIPIKSTFLGAHAYPERFSHNHEGYIKEIIDVMLPRVAGEGLADYLDVFCEKGYFGLKETQAILEKGNALGLKSRIHVNQFNSFGGVQVAAKCGALSVEHLEVLGDGDIDTIVESNMLPVALPACSFFLGIPYTPVRDLLNAGLPLVLASDFNPGSSPIYNLSFVLSLACIRQKLLPEEAFNALTINAAHALELENEVGSIAIGKKAHVNFFDAKSLAEIPYYAAGNLIRRTVR